MLCRRTREENGLKFPAPETKHHTPQIASDNSVFPTFELDGS